MDGPWGVCTGAPHGGQLDRIDCVLRGRQILLARELTWRFGIGILPAALARPLSTLAKSGGMWRGFVLLQNATSRNTVIQYVIRLHVALLAAKSGGKRSDSTQYK